MLALAGLGVAPCAVAGASRTQIGESREGRPIVVRTLGDRAVDAHGRGVDDRPAIAVIAGLDARHRIGRDVALGLALRLEADHPDLLRDRTVYILASANPDGFARLSGGLEADSGRSVLAADADRDGRVDEDPADDLNGDGVITMMRVERPGPETGLTAQWVLDDADPRLLRKPEADDGEVATHALLIEGLDNDGDGAFNEDGFGGTGGGGVDFDRNFPSLWPELEDGAGLYPLSEPETRAIVEWLQSRPNVAAVLTYGPGDTLVNVPAAKQYDETGRLPKGLESGDKPAFERLAGAYSELTGIENAPKFDAAGSLNAWAYSDLGVWSMRSCVWARPKPEKPAEDQPDPAEAQAEPEEAAPFDEREALIERGTDPRIADFLVASDEERRRIVESFDSAPPEERQAIMDALAKSPPDVQARAMAIAQGEPDPGPADAPPGEGGTAEKAEPAKKPGDSEDAKWLAYLDEHADGGFVDWAAFDHPQLGMVEIGGFRPGARMNPPESEVRGLIEGQTAFVADVLGRLADLEVGEPTVERLGTGLWWLRVGLSNAGKLPTVTAIGLKARRLPPTVASVGVEADRVLVGEKVRRFDVIPGGGTPEHAEWVISGEAGEAVQIEIRSARFGDRTLTVTLKEVGR